MILHTKKYKENVKCYLFILTVILKCGLMKKGDPSNQVKPSNQTDLMTYPYCSIMPLSEWTNHFWRAGSLDTIPYTPLPLHLQFVSVFFPSTFSPFLFFQVLLLPVYRLLPRGSFAPSQLKSMMIMSRVTHLPLMP